MFSGIVIFAPSHHRKNWRRQSLTQIRRELAGVRIIPCRGSLDRFVRWHRQQILNELRGNVSVTSYKGHFDVAHAVRSRLQKTEILSRLGIGPGNVPALYVGINGSRLSPARPSARGTRKLLPDPSHPTGIPEWNVGRQPSYCDWTWQPMIPLRDMNCYRY